MRVAIALGALVVVLIAIAFIPLLQPSPPSTDQAAVRAIVAEMLAERDAEERPPIVAPITPAPVDEATIGPIVEDYLVANPRILQRMSEALETEIRTAQAATTKDAIAKYREAIFEAPGQVVIGNPEGDVTLVEMFDYNCSYCRGALPDLAALIADDPNLRIVLKEFPILSKESVDAARIGVLVAEQSADYWAFHQKLFTTRGQVNADAALAAARELGLNPVTLRMDMESAKVTETIEKSYEIARALNITGTPTYIIGEELIPGAVPIEQLKTRIANMRACGKTACEGNG